MERCLIYERLKSANYCNMCVVLTNTLLITFVVPQALEILCAFVTPNRHKITATVRLRWDSSDGQVVSETQTRE